MSDLEQRLTELGRELDWPETPDLAPAVRRRLEAPARQPRRRPVLLRRSFAIAIAALLLLAGGVFAAVPGVRDAVLEFFGLQGATVERRAKLPEAPELRPLNLGTRTTLDRARRSLGFEPLVPSAAGRPDAVYTSQQVPGGELSLAYRPRPGLPEAHSTSLGLLVGEFRGDLAPEYLGKIAGQTTKIERLRVDGQRGDLDRGRSAPVLLPAAGFRLRGERAAPRRQRAAAGAREPDGAPGGRVRPRARGGARPLAALVPLREAPQRDGVPEHQEQQRDEPGGNRGGRRAVEEVRDECDRACHGGREQREAGDREPVAAHHDSLLVLLAELEAVVRGGRDQTRTCRRRTQEGHEVDRLLKARDVRKALVERHDEQEREQHLNTRECKAQLTEKLLEVAIEPLLLGLLAPRVLAP